MMFSGLMRWLAKPPLAKNLHELLNRPLEAVTPFATYKDWLKACTFEQRIVFYDTVYGDLSAAGVIDPPPCSYREMTMEQGYDLLNNIFAKSPNGLLPFSLANRAVHHAIEEVNRRSQSKIDPD